MSFKSVLVQSCLLVRLSVAANLHFHDHRTGGDSVYIYWVKSAPLAWPPAPPADLNDNVRIRCRLGKRKQAQENLIQDGGSADNAVALMRKDIDVRGEFVITVRKDWAPLGAQHFLTMVDKGFFNGICLFRAVKNFLVQFGVSANPAMDQEFGRQTIRDDPLKPELLPLPHGTLAYAGSGPNSRSSQLWLSFGTGVAGKEPWETPVGYVAPQDGLDLVDSINTQYADMAAFGGNAPDQSVFKQGVTGLEYLRTKYPEIDYFESCVVTDERLDNQQAGKASAEELIQVDVVQPGTSRMEGTHIGHTFVAKLGGKDGKVMGRFTVTKEEEHVQLSLPNEL